MVLWSRHWWTGSHSPKSFQADALMPVTAIPSLSLSPGLKQWRRLLNLEDQHFRTHCLVICGPCSCIELFQNPFESYAPTNYRLRGVEIVYSTKFSLWCCLSCTCRLAMLYLGYLEGHHCQRLFPSKILPLLLLRERGVLNRLNATTNTIVSILVLLLLLTL